ncbi:hypothetical protein BJ741DRAFT_600549 [Chytriomyces cf. hyalinus JEL632]|nr:hypothetical protein BJ741DRAFT_600549 [Chytriomyces cf. hyalinus JEL632]
MLSYESVSIPADSPEPIVRTSLFALLWKQQQQQQQSFAAIAHRLVSSANSVPHVRSNNTHTAPSPQSSEACSPASVGSPVHGQGMPPSDRRSLSSNDPFVALKHAAAVQTQTKRPRKTSLRSVAEDPQKPPLDACQLKKLQKAERKKRREMNRKLVCFNCGATSSPIWRRTIDRKNNICNACGLYFKNHKCHKPVRTVVSPVSLSSPATDASDQLPTPEPASDTFLDDFLNFDDGSTELSHDAAAFLPFSTSLLPSAVAEIQDCFTIPHAADHAANTLSLEIQQFLQPLAHFPPHLPSELKYSAAAGMDLTFSGVLWSSQEC